jgi:hypothetical protein
MTAFEVPENFFEEAEDGEDYDLANAYGEETEDQKKEKIKYYIG